MSEPGVSQRVLLFAGACSLFALIIVSGMAVQFILQNRTDVNDLFKARKEGEALAAKVAEISRAKAEADAKIAAFQKEKSDAEGQLAAAKKEKADAETLGAAAKKAKADADAAAAAHADEKKKLEERATKAEGEAGALKKSLDDLTAAHAKVRDEAQVLKADRMFVSGEIASLREGLEALLSDSAAHMKASSDEAVRSAADAAGAALAELRGRFEATDHGVKGTSERLDAALAEIARLNAKLEQAGKDLAAMRAAQSGADTKSADLSRQFASVLPLLKDDKTPATPVPATVSLPFPLPDEPKKPEAEPAAKAAKDVAKDDPAPSTPPPPPAPAPRIEARIEIVRDEVVVITAGAKAGVSVGREFEIRRGDVSIARAQITRVGEEYSGARLLRVQEGRDVRVGDLAVAEAR